MLLPDIAFTEPTPTRHRPDHTTVSADERQQEKSEMVSPASTCFFLLVILPIITVWLADGCVLPHKPKKRRSNKKEQSVLTFEEVRCYSGSECRKRQHCVRKSPDNAFGHCQPFLRSGQVCTFPTFTIARPEEIVDQRRCAVGLVCMRMGHHRNPHEKHCTSLT